MMSSTKHTLMSLMIAALTLAATSVDRAVFAAQVEEESASQASESSSIDELLANELGYDAQQIEQFKANVADMPQQDLRALVMSMKHTAGDADQMQEARLDEHRRMISRLTAANRLALSRPIQQVPFQNSKPDVRHTSRNPARASLFRGYVVWLRAQ